MQKVRIFAQKICILRSGLPRLIFEAGRLGLNTEKKIIKNYKVA